MDFARTGGRTKQIPRKSTSRKPKPGSTRIEKPKYHGYANDLSEDSDGSKFSQGRHGHNNSGDREEKRRQDVKDKLIKSQRERDMRREHEQEVDLTDERREFDGVNLDGNEKTDKMVENLRRQGLQGFDVNEYESKKGCKRRGEKHQQNSLSNLRSSGGGRMLKKDRDRHQQQSMYASSAEFRNSKNFKRYDPLDEAEERQRSPKNITQRIGGNMDVILNTSNVGRERKAYGGGDMTSKRDRKKQQQHNQQQQTHRQSQKSKQQHHQHQQQQQQQQQNPQQKHKEQTMGRIPRKKEITIQDVADTPQFNNTFLDVPQYTSSYMQDIHDFTSNSPTGKRKDRDSVVEELEVAHGRKDFETMGKSKSNKNSMKCGKASPVGLDSVDMDLSKDEIHVDNSVQDEISIDSDTKDMDVDSDMVQASPSTHDVEMHDVDDVMKSIQRPLTDEEYGTVKTPKTSRGRSFVGDDSFELQPSCFESETKKVDSTGSTFGVGSLGLRRVNNGGSEKKRNGKKTKTQVDMGNRFKSKKDDLQNDSDSDHKPSNRESGDGWNTTRKKRGKDKRSDKTWDRLKRSGMPPSTPSDDEYIDTSSSKKKNSPPPTRRSRSRSRSKPKLEGSTHDNAITIDDSDSDESSAGEDLAEAVPVSNEEDEDIVFSQESQTRRTRATGDNIRISVARIAMGKKVYKSKCELQFQPSSKEPYLQFLFSLESKVVKIVVKLTDDELKELAYYVAKDEDDGGLSSDSAESISFIAFRIQPSKVNKLDKFSKWYDGRDGKEVDKKYITVEVRDEEEFKELLKVMEKHQYLEPYCNDAKKEFYELDAYTKALLEDSKVEKAKRRSGPRTRSKGVNTTISDSENKLLVVYPFEIEEEELQSISSNLKELGGDRLGVPETVDDMSETENMEEENQEGEQDVANRAETGTLTRTHYLSIREDDKERLEPGQFLNDTLVDFWMSWISRGSTSSSSSKVHFFTSHFLTTLQDEGTKGVASWTKNKKKEIQVFEKKFIFVPVNGDLHWSLCVIVNPGLILKLHEMKEDDIDESEMDGEWPCILFLDSLRMHRKNHVANMVRRWLNFEWNRTMKDTHNFIEDPFTKKMKLITPKVPYQENGCDCGVFVCRYAYNLYIMRDQVFSLHGMENNFKDLITNGPAFDFGMSDIARIRKEFKLLVDSLSGLYSQFKQKEKAKKAAAKRKENELPKATTQDEGVVPEEKENSPLSNNEPGGEISL